MEGARDPIPFVVRGDAQRRTLDALLVKDDFSDLPELSDRTLLTFRNLVRTHNLIISLHPEKKKIDENLREGFRTDTDPLEKLKSISDLYRSKKEIDNKSRETLKFLESKVDGEESNERSNLLALGFIGNFVQSTASWIWENRRKVGAGIVSTGSAVYFAGSWLVANEAWVLSTFPIDSSIGALVRAALQVLKGLPLL